MAGQGADRDELTDQRVIARILEMRRQGYSFRGIATALAKWPEYVKDILEGHRLRNSTRADLVVDRKSEDLSTDLRNTNAASAAALGACSTLPRVYAASSISPTALAQSNAIITPQAGNRRR
jgi:hypothetical protein